MLPRLSTSQSSSPTPTSSPSTAQVNTVRSDLMYVLNCSIFEPNTMVPIVAYRKRMIKSSAMKWARSWNANESVRVTTPMRGWKSQYLRNRSRQRKMLMPFMVAYAPWIWMMASKLSTTFVTNFSRCEPPSFSSSMRASCVMSLYTSYLASVSNSRRATSCAIHRATHVMCRAMDTRSM